MELTYIGPIIQELVDNLTTNMSEENTNLILRELDLLRKENRDDHGRIEKHAEHTNGTVAELVAWKIQVRTVLWIFGILMGSVVIPVGVNLLSKIISKHL